MYLFDLRLIISILTPCYFASSPT